MMFFKKSAATAPAEPKRRSTLGLLFNPEIGASVRPLAQAVEMFSTLVAMVLAMNGLFPKDHPNLTGAPEGRLGLKQVMVVAYRRLSFTRAGLPKVVLFFAVAGMMVFSALALLTFALTLFVGHAHAQAATCDTGSMFAACSQGTDLAQGWMDFLFKGKPLPIFVDTNGIAANYSNGIQGALITALGFYSSAILVLAAIILFYHLTVMIVQTAHSGVPMGQASKQIWVPIRLVFAIGLLVPINNGLSSGQFMAIQIAEWGSGLGDQVWNRFVDNFVKDSYAAPPAPIQLGLANGLVESAACMKMFNAITDRAAGASGPAFSANHITPVHFGQAPGVEGYNFESQIGEEHECGGYQVGPAVNGTGVAATLGSAVHAAQMAAMQAAFTKAKEDVDAAMVPGPADADGNPTYAFLDSGASKPAYMNVLDDVANTYQDSINKGLLAATQNSFKASDNTDWTAMGWVSAGAYLNRVAGDEAAINDSVRASGTPSTIPATLKSFRGSWSDPASNYKSAQKGITGLMDWAHLASGYVTANTQVTGSASCNNNVFEQFMNAKAHFGTSMVDDMFMIADYEAAANCVWRPYVEGSTSPQLGLQLTSGDPFTEMVRLGHANLNTAYDILNSVIAIELVAGGSDGMGEFLQQSVANDKGFGPFVGTVTGGTFKLAGAAARVIGGVLSFLGLVFFVAGFTLAYFLPLIPFIRFFFGTLTWVVMVMESVVMIPLVALAHLSPEGEGLPGANAKASYYFLFNIMLRPALMVFGLICGLLVFMAAVFFMNKLYGLAITPTTVGDVHPFMSHLVFSVLYVALLYIAANNSFKLVNTFSDHAMSWMGGQAAPKESIGEAEHLGQSISLVSGYAGQQMFTQLTQGAQAGGKALGGVLGGTGKVIGKHRGNVQSGNAALSAFNGAEFESQMKGYTHWGANGKKLPNNTVRPIPPASATDDGFYKSGKSMLGDSSAAPATGSPPASTPDEGGDAGT
ncbi:MAG: DotA/TraY family protein [Alphaproteobacteria bacterium]|nr:DotA/TraY family protein [Alphaproteobacteria bacterium]